MNNWKSVEQGMPHEGEICWIYDTKSKELLLLLYSYGAWCFVSGGFYGNPEDISFWKSLETPLPPCPVMPLDECVPADDWNGNYNPGDIRCKNCSDPEAFMKKFGNMIRDIPK